jgi:hypothetical protein
MKLMQIIKVIQFLVFVDVERRLIIFGNDAALRMLRVIELIAF